MRLYNVATYVPQLHYYTLGARSASAVVGGVSLQTNIQAGQQNGIGIVFLACFSKYPDLEVWSRE